MYILKHGIKKDPVRRWALPDRIFFGYGACYILAGAFLQRPPLEGFHAEWIVPADGFSGNHIFVTNGVVAFDHHGYSRRAALLAHHQKGWASRNDGWACALERVDFDLLDTMQLNQRRMLGPDQYLHDAIFRARCFIDRVDHKVAARRALG